MSSGEEGTVLGNRAPRRGAPRAAQLWERSRPVWPIAAVVVALIIVFAVTQRGFLTKANLESALTSVTDLWLVSMGMTIVLISGGFDLSAGAVAAICGYFMARLFETHIPGGLVIVFTLLFGVAIGGIVNGLLIGRLRLNVFVVTLATMTALSGVLNLWSGTNSVYVTAPIAYSISGGTLLGFQTPLWIMAVSLVGFLYLQRRTYFGRDVFALGGSYVAARLSGIRTDRTVVCVYALLGACAAAAGIIDVTQAGAASPTVDDTLPLQAIAAVLLGGTPLTGGAGSVGGTAVGVLFIGLLQNGLGLAGISSSWQNIVTGIVLVVAVLGGRLRRGQGRGRKAQRGQTTSAEGR